ncbi:hypothetical protein A1O1_00594 [Capronia coronata CBS 617.96]|uniref:Zn(2)-C6 fungal-type domain-containing protein n=1 Tax=Capronia coronata CBS 617.96 TaxID=1182541 RepID=W9YRG0_9EURO|nr:uncharacterized protein A1O1_00594 [Capronia coronata CBS 617.96]EXJ95472.1 hypothetical protein A1O1_00594 [Capronia coronata CBS 617.96]
MQDHPEGISSRRRVRTGCLTCRGRRRKCDEEKPVCLNCKNKNLQCRYGLNITFVESKFNAANKAAKSVPSVEYPTVRFVDKLYDANSTLSEEDAGGAALPDHLGTSPRPSSTQGEDVQRPHSPYATQDRVVLSTTPISLANNLPPESLQRMPLSPTFHTPQLLFAPSPAVFGSESTPIPSTTHFAPDHELTSRFKEPMAGVESALLSDNTSVTQGQELYEIDLLTYYRYRIAPQLDLGVGDSYYGVRTLHRAEHAVAVYQGILALSAALRARGNNLLQQEGDARKDMEYSVRAGNSIVVAEDEDRVTTILLLTLRDVIMNPPRFWGDRVGTLQANALLRYGEMLDEHWQMLARLTLAATLAAGYNSSLVDLSFVLQGVPPIFSARALTHKEQLRQSFAHLARALMFANRDSPESGRSLTMPLTATWQSCWSDNQLWFSARNEEMQQIFEVPDSDGIDTPFPIIMFSNLCALVANFVHHLAALVLINHKPRMIKAIAEVGSSPSSVWHAQRVIGMIAALNEADDIFDPLIVAGVMYAARRLSHPSQLAVVADVLGQASRSSGFQLQEEIQKLDITYSTAVC